jgi:hypothetical protein
MDRMYRQKSALSAVARMPKMLDKKFKQVFDAAPLMTK